MSVTITLVIISIIIFLLIYVSLKLGKAYEKLEREKQRNEILRRENLITRVRSNRELRDRLSKFKNK